MIIAEQKPIEEILKIIGDAGKLLVAGCGACVAVCFAGGEKEVGILASTIRLARKKEGKEIEVLEATPLRQCEEEWVKPLADLVGQADVVLSIACGVGVQTMVDYFPEKIVVPGLNTTSFGRPLEMGVWTEYCRGCGDCILHLTGGICPVTRCSKSLMNGPCGGSENGMCEVDPKNTPCAWQLIYDRLKALGKLHLMEEIVPIKGWNAAWDGGVRTTVREDLKQ
ncbi:MAG: methylenetetrahydrofolate reductase C-terminal domain-containing protein [bacterium]